MYHSGSSDETRRLGREIARGIARKGFFADVARNAGAKNGATVFALEGEIGAGKTTFVQGFCEGLGLKKRAMSPTFVIMRRHALRRLPNGTSSKSNFFTNVFHVDAYRLKKSADLAALGIQTIFSTRNNIVLIEWPERAKGIMPKNAIRLKFAHGTRDHERTIVLAEAAAKYYHDGR